MSPTRADMTSGVMRESPVASKKVGIRRVASLEDTTSAVRINVYDKLREEDHHRPPRIQRSMQQSQSLQNFAGKILKKKSRRQVPKDPFDEDLIEVYADLDLILKNGTRNMEQEGVDDDDVSVYSDTRYKSYEPVLKGNDRYGNPKVQNVPVRRLAPQEKMRKPTKMRGSIDSEGLDYPNQAGLRADRDKIRELEERLERMEREKFQEFKAQPKKNEKSVESAAGKKKVKLIERKERNEKPSPFIAHIPKYGRQLPLPAEKEKAKNNYMLPKIVPDEEDASSFHKGPRVKRSEQIAKDALRGKPRNPQKEEDDDKKLPNIVKKSRHSSNSKSEMRHISEKELGAIKSKAKERALKNAGVDFTDREIREVVIEHADVKYKVSQLESQVRAQRVMMEDNPGEVTAEAEADTIALEREVREMRAQVDLAAFKPSQENEKIMKGLEEQSTSQVKDMISHSKVTTPKSVKKNADLLSESSSPRLSSSSNSKVNNRKFKKGDKVEGLYEGRDIWYPGIIGKEFGDDTYDIHYDDGEIETHVKEDWIRKLEPRKKIKFVVGTLVEAQYGGQAAWYSGKIVVDRGDDTYDVRYDDGDSETHVRADLIRTIAVTNESSKAVNVISKSDTDYYKDEFEDDDLEPKASSESTLSSPPYNKSSNLPVSVPKAAELDQESVYSKSVNQNAEDGDPYDEDFEDDDN